MARRYADFVEDAEEIARYYWAAQRGTPAAFLQAHYGRIEFVIPEVDVASSSAPIPVKGGADSNKDADWCRDGAAPLLTLRRQARQGHRSPQSPANGGGETQCLTSD
jgi:hypothetical protein